MPFLTPINEKIDQALESEHSSELKSLLLNVKELLAESQDGEEIEKIKKAINLMESISFIDSENKVHVVGIYLRSKHIEALDEKLCTNPNVKSISENDFHTLLEIHKSLMQLCNQYTPVWEYSYSPNENDEIMNSAIAEWKVSFMSPSATDTEEDLALYDFKRDVSILGKVGGSDAEIIKRIESFANSISDDNEVNTNIANWLKKNGGQDNHGFVQFCVLQNHFSTDDAAQTEKFGIGASTSIKNDWSIENGECYFNFDLLIRTLQNGMVNETILRNIRGKDETSVLAKEKILSNAKERNSIPPLLRIKGKIRYQYHKTQNIMEPTVILLNATGYTPSLHSPKEIFTEQDDTNPESTAYKASIVLKQILTKESNKVINLIRNFQGAKAYYSFSHIDQVSPMAIVVHALTEKNIREISVTKLQSAINKLNDKLSEEVKFSLNVTMLAIRYQNAVNKQTKESLGLELKTMLTKNTGKVAINLSGVNLTGLDLSMTVLDLVNFTNANLTDVNLSHASIKNTVFSNSILKNTNIFGLNLQVAHVDKTDFGNLIFLNKESVQEVEVNATSIFLTSHFLKWHQLTIDFPDQANNVCKSAARNIVNIFGNRKISEQIKIFEDCLENPVFTVEYGKSNVNSSGVLKWLFPEKKEVANDGYKILSSRIVELQKDQSYKNMFKQYRG